MTPVSRRRGRPCKPPGDKWRRFSFKIPPFLHDAVAKESLRTGDSMYRVARRILAEKLTPQLLQDLR